MDIIKLDNFPMNPEPNNVYEIIPDKAKIVSSTNRLFNKYPTRYISAVPRFAINKYSAPGDSVLDPFCGSGTTAIEAMLLSRNALSIDIDPFARLLIKAKTTIYSNEDLQTIQKIVQFLQDNPPDSSGDYPVPEIPNIEKWFCEESILGLSYIKHTIDRLCKANPNVKDYLYVVLAAIIRKVSNADEVSPKPYVSTRYPKTPAVPLELFLKVETMYREAIKEFSDATRDNGCQSIILAGNDARAVSAIHDVDLGVTSPPYINAYDYVRSLKFEDLWLGLADDAQLKNNRKKYIGTEISGSFYETYVYASQSATLAPLVESITKVDKKRAGVVNTYFEDMALNMLSVKNALKQNGRYVIVVGDSNIRGQEIPTARVLTEIAEKNGFSYELSFKYVIRDRYLHLPRGGRGGIIKYDEILVLRKD
jgi:DNA modification methylase